jgi:hypothetical protein
METKQKYNEPEIETLNQRSLEQIRRFKHGSSVV